MTQLHCDIGTVIDEKYELVSLLGAGAASAVYRARQLQQPKNFRVKIVTVGSDLDADTHKQLGQALKALSQINNPHLARLYDYGFTRTDELYMAGDLVEGQLLTDTLTAIGRLQQSAALKIFCQICDGLASAHGQGLVHGNLKPSNIIITTTKDSDQFVKIIDPALPLAAQQESPGHQGASMAMKGFPSTPSICLSPEQAVGGPVDQRTDIYLLGALMYECLTSAPPDADPKPFKPTLSIAPSLESIVLRCLSQQPSARFQSMKELKSALLGLSGGASGILQSDNDSSGRPGLSKGPGPALAAGSLALCLTALAAGGLWFYGQQPEESPASVTDTPAAPRAGSAAPNAGPLPENDKGPASKQPTITAPAALSNQENYTSPAINASPVVSPPSGAPPAPAKNEPPPPWLSDDKLPAISDSVQLPQKHKTLSPEKLVKIGLSLRRENSLDPNLPIRARYFLTAIRKDPHYAPAYSSLGEFYWLDALLAKKVEDQVAAKKKVIAVINANIKVHPEDPGLYDRRGQILIQLGRKQDAVASAQKAVSINPDEHKFHTDLGLCLAEAGKYEEAIKELEPHVRPNDPGSVYTLAACYQNLKRDQVAIDFTTNWMKDHGPDAGLLMVRADSYVDSQMYKKALDDFTAIEQKFPSFHIRKLRGIDIKKCALAIAAGKS